MADDSLFLAAKDELESYQTELHNRFLRGLETKAKEILELLEFQVPKGNFACENVL